MCYLYEKYYKSIMSACSALSDSLQFQCTANSQTPLSMEFSRQDYWNGLSFPTPGDLPKPITEQYYIANCVSWIPRLGSLNL